MTRAADPSAPRAVSTASPCTCLRLRKLSRQLTNLYDQHLQPFGLTVTQFSLLAHLRTLDGVGIGALADAMVMDPTALTRALRPLERAGLLSLTPCAKDKRARLLHLTDKGRATYEAARPGWRLAQQHIDGLLESRDLTGLNGLLDGLIAMMKTNLGSGAKPSSPLSTKDIP